MNRRTALQSVASAVAGARFIALGSGSLSSRDKSNVSKSKRFPPRVEASDGVGLFYRDCGRGRPIVFLAPWGLHSDWWEYQMAYLVDKGFRCIAYDRRGHGRSDEPSGGYEFDTLADDLKAVIEHLDLQGVTLVGQSMGCGEMVRYLTRHKGIRIARVVMVAPITPLIMKAADNPDGIDASYLEKVRQALSTDRPHVIAAAAPSFFGAPTNSVSTEMMQWWINMLLQCPLRVLLDLHRMFTCTDFRLELQEITLPTLILQGDNDTSTPIDLTGRKTAALVRGSQLTVYKGAAHGLPITHMDRLNRDLLAFTQREAAGES
jgi:non-heme chloroperoxidase